jgi:hypothetical protein
MPKTARVRNLTYGRGWRRAKLCGPQALQLDCSQGFALRQPAVSKYTSPPVRSNLRLGAEMPPRAPARNYRTSWAASVALREHPQKVSSCIACAGAEVYDSHTPEIENRNPL